MSQKHPIAVLSLLLVTLVVGCVSISIYWPERELEDAADEIVNEVRASLAESAGDEIEAQDAVEGALNKETGSPSTLKPRYFATRFIAARFQLVPTAYAEEQEPKVKIEISTPKIKKIKAALKTRFKELIPWFDRNVFGEGHDGFLVIRDETKLGLKEKRKIRALHKAENADRTNLYKEIASENKIAKEKIKRIGELFSKSWQRKCKVGWWIEPEAGKWVKKPKKKKKKKGAKGQRGKGAEG